MAEDHEIVGRVLRASTRGFACGTHSDRISDRHNFGAFVKVPVANSVNGDQAIGLIYKVEIQDDPLVSELVMGEYMPENILRDQRQNRMVPVEVMVLNIGYMEGGAVIHSLPPRPPMSLSEVLLCTDEEVYYFTQRYAFFRMVLNASEVPADDLLASALRVAATIYGDERERYDFLVQCGRQLARDLSHDLKRLSHILALIRP